MINKRLRTLELTNCHLTQSTEIHYSHAEIIPGISTSVVVSEGLSTKSFKQMATNEMQLTLDRAQEHTTVT